MFMDAFCIFIKYIWYLENMELFACSHGCIGNPAVLQSYTECGVCLTVKCQVRLGQCSGRVLLQPTATKLPLSRLLAILVSDGGSSGSVAFVCVLRETNKHHF